MPGKKKVIPKSLSKDMFIGPFIEKKVANTRSIILIIGVRKDNNEYILQRNADLYVIKNSGQNMLYLSMNCDNLSRNWIICSSPFTFCDFNAQKNTLEHKFRTITYVNDIEPVCDLARMKYTHYGDFCDLLRYQKISLFENSKITSALADISFIFDNN